MAKHNYLSQSKLEKALFARTEGYAANVRSIYQKALSEIIDLVKGTELEDGLPFSFKDYGYSEEVTPILRRMYSETYQAIRAGVSKEWLNANANNDELVKAVFGEKSIEDNHFAKYFKRNQDAMDAFFARKTEGLNLSQKVWNLTGHYKDELENSLDLAIGEGTPAMKMASKIKGYLNDPDRYYRRFRYKTGEDEAGNPIYGLKWKRRVWDKESESYKWIDAKPSKYRSGKGVYRSSARNAQRLARTETNIAYREADYLRWQDEEFVIGVEIKLSNNHPIPDICDDLAGIYPKNFKWTGWHPNCRCYMVPLLAKDKEIDEMLSTILDGGDPGDVSVDGEVTELPGQFTTWMEDNKARVETATQKGTLPYFIKDNLDVINPTEPTPQEVAKIRHNARTPEDIERIKTVWNERKAVYQYGNNVLDIMGGISDVDTSSLSEALEHADQQLVLQEAAKLKQIGKQIYALDLLDDPMAVAKQFSMKDAIGVQNAVKTKFQGWADKSYVSDWASLDLDTKLKKLNYEVQWLPMNYQGKAWERTWEVSFKAYKKELLKVQDTIEWNNINSTAAIALNYKTKSKTFLDLSNKLQEALDSKNKVQAQKLLSEIQLKRSELEKAAAKRVLKNAPKDPFEAKAYTDNRKNAALWAKSPEDADKYLRSQAEQLWNTAAKEQREAAYYYTSGSCYLNEPLRGISYTGGKGRDYAIDMKALTEYIEKSPLEQDMWLQRGENMSGLRGRFGIDLYGKSVEDAQVYVGKKGTEKAFLSHGDSKGAGFGGEIIYNVYCPKGTRGLYIEPFSHYGHGVNGKYGMNDTDGLLWDGKTMQSSFGREAEVLLQRGTQFEIKKITRSGNSWYIDVDVIGQTY